MSTKLYTAFWGALTISAVYGQHDNVVGQVIFTVIALSSLGFDIYFEVKERK